MWIDDSSPNPLDPQFRAGQPLDLETLRRIAEMSGRVDHISVAGGMGSDSGTGGVQVFDQTPFMRWIRITAQSPGIGTGVPPQYYYSWEPVVPRPKHYVYDDGGGPDDYYGFDPDPLSPTYGQWLIDPDDPWELDDQCGSGTYAAFPAIEVNKNVEVQYGATGTVCRAWLGDDGRSLAFDVVNTTTYIDRTITITGGTVNTTNVTTNNTNVTNTVTGGSNTYNNTTNSYTGTTSNTYSSTTTNTFSGILVIQGPTYAPHYSFASWSGNINNLDLSSAPNPRVRVASDQHFRELTGIAPGASPSGRILCLHNVGNFVILIAHGSTASVAANRILTTTANWYWLAPGHEVTLVYDNTDSRWRVSESSDERLGGVTTYSAWGANQNDLAINPYYEQHRVSSSAAVDLTGIQYGKPGLRQRLINHGTTYTITLKHESASSSAVNRFDLPGQSDLKLHPRSEVMLDYDGISERWRVVAYRDLFTEKQIVHATTNGVPTSTPDFTREAEGVIQQTRDSDTLNPEHIQIRRRASAGDVDTGDIIAVWAGYGKVDGAEELLGLLQVVYSGTGTNVEGRTELWGVSDSGANRGLVVQYDGTVLLDEASTPDKLLGTANLDGSVICVNIGTGLSYNSGTSTLSATLPAMTLDDLTDVIITSPTVGQVLSHNGSEWVNSHLYLGSLLDVFVPAPNDGDVLTWDAGSLAWVAAAPSTSGVSDGDKVDIVVSSGGTVWTIDTGVVTFAKIQDITTDRLLGRDTAGTGDVEELTVSGGLEFTGSGGIRRSALTGDVTASAGSGTTTIANDTVTDAKLRDSAGLSVIGRSANSTGDPADITASVDKQVLRRSGTSLGFGLLPIDFATAVAARAYHNANQSISNTTWTNLALNSELFDTDAFHDNSTNNSRMTVPTGKGGKYMIVGQALFASNTTGVRLARLTINGTTELNVVRVAPISGGIDTDIVVLAFAELAAGDYVEIGVWQNSGGNLDVLNAGSYGPSLALALLGA